MNNNKPTENRPRPPHTRTYHEKLTTDGMHLMRSYSYAIKHLMTECNPNEEEGQKHKIPTNLYEIIGPDCQPENVKSFLRTIEIEKYI